MVLGPLGITHRNTIKKSEGSYWVTVRQFTGALSDQLQKEDKITDSSQNLLDRDGGGDLMAAVSKGESKERTEVSEYLPV